MALALIRPPSYQIKKEILTDQAPHPHLVKSEACLAGRTTGKPFHANEDQQPNQRKQGDTSEQYLPGSHAKIGVVGSWTYDRWHHLGQLRSQSGREIHLLPLLTSRLSASPLQPTSGTWCDNCRVLTPYHRKCGPVLTIATATLLQPAVVSDHLDLYLITLISISIPR